MKCATTCDVCGHYNANCTECVTCEKCGALLDVEEIEIDPDFEDDDEDEEEEWDRFDMQVNS